MKPRASIAGRLHGIGAVWRILAFVLAMLFPGLVFGQSVPAGTGSASGNASSGRVALLVGVSAYRNAQTLLNPVNDAQAMTEALKRLGFATDTVINPDRTALEAAVRRFGIRARGAEAALVFFAGHAVEHAGLNWLLPASADIQRDRDLRFEALDLDSVLEQIDGARLALVFLDACRDNPFRLRLTGTRGATPTGLAPVRTAVGTLVAFATAPGTVADDGGGTNSPFTAALLRRIETSGLELRQLLTLVRRDVRETTGGRQVPWEHSSLEGDFYFAGPPPLQAPPPAVARPGPLAQAGPGPGMTGTRTNAGTEVELLFWETVRNSRDTADFRAYLARYPDGVFASLAQNRLKQLGANPSGQSQPAGASAQQSPTGGLSAASDAGRIANTPAPGSASGSALSAASPPALASGAAPPIAVRPMPPPVRPAEGLTAEALAAAIPYLRPDKAAEEARAYLAAVGPYKALAVNPQARSVLRLTEQAPRVDLEQVTLERCQLSFGSPCALVVVDMVLQRPEGGWVARAMPRVDYGGSYDPARVPGFFPGDAAVSQTLNGYAGAAAPKAMAIHPAARVHVRSAMATAREAEQLALRDCNEDALRRRLHSTCLLYATGNTVVLPLRSRAAITPQPPSVGSTRPVARDGSAREPAGDASPQPLNPADLAAAMPFVAPDEAADLARRYFDGAGPHKAIAVNPARRATWRGAGFPMPDGVGDAVMERCQMFYASPCILVAIDRTLQRPPSGWASQSMPRVVYNGPYDPERVPGLSTAERAANESIRGYRTMGANRAMAIHPRGRVFAQGGVPTRQEAEATVLRICNEEARRDNLEGGCYLYATGDRVVLPQRRQTASEAMAARTDAVGTGAPPSAAAPVRPEPAAEARPQVASVPPAAQPNQTLKPGASGDATSLNRSAECVVTGNWVNRLDWQGEMTMRSDRGWCWLDTWRFDGPTKVAPRWRLSVPPNFGEVQIVRMSDTTRIAYKPRQGVIGKDTFTTADETFNSSRTFNVTFKP